MTRVEIASAVKQIIAAVVDEHGLMEARDVVTVGSKLHDDLGMDEVDQMEVLFRAEERFGLVLPDHPIGPSGLHRRRRLARQIRFEQNRGMRPPRIGEQELEANHAAEGECEDVRFLDAEVVALCQCVHDYRPGCPRSWPNEQGCKALLDPRKHAPV